MSDVLKPPFLPIEGVRNFRDFGGYVAHGGQRVVTGLMYRSGAYARMTQTGLGQFKEIGIKVVIDLRRGPERQAQPSPFTGLPLEVVSSSVGDGDGVSLPPHLQFIADGDLSFDACHAHMLRSYRRIPWEPQHANTFREAFMRLGSGHGPLLVHCAAGKDRTGILCGLILHSLGVSAEDILHDYLLTNVVPLDTDWLEDYAARLSVQFERTIEPVTLLPMLGVHRDYLEEAWAEMARRDGGLDGFLDRIGVDQALRVAIRSRLLDSDS